MSLRRERILVALLSVIYHTGIAVWLGHIIVNLTSCKTPATAIGMLLLSHTIWILFDLHTILTIHPEDVTGPDASREKHRRYKKDIAGIIISYIMRFLMIIVAAVLLKANACFKNLGVLILIEIFMYTYVNVLYIYVIEPIYGGTACVAMFKNIRIRSVNINTNPEMTPILQV